MAVAAEQRKRTDGRDLVEQLGVVGTVMFQLHGAGAGHPADLAFQLGDRLLDPPRGRFRLLAHRVGQRALGGAVADPGLQRAVDREHEHHQADQGDDVFGEQAPAPRLDFVRDPDHPDPRARHPNGHAHPPSHVSWACLAQFEQGQAGGESVVSRGVDGEFIACGTPTP
jgi:hypothetical protein